MPEHSGEAGFTPENESTNTLRREDAVPVEIGAGEKLDGVVQMLIAEREKGNSVVATFNGQELFSADVTMDSAYLAVLGKTKAEFEEGQEKFREEGRRRGQENRARAIEKIPEWIAQAEKLGIPENLRDEWKDLVEARARDLYNGFDLENAIAVMEKLNEGGTDEEVEAVLDSAGHSGMSFGSVRNIVSTFSKKGEEFFDRIDR